MMNATFVKPDMSRPITSVLWGQIEEYYRDSIDRIHIPEDPKPFDITRINSQLEALYHEARLDYYYAMKAHENVARSYKMLKRSLWPIVKGGKNAEEREFMMQEYLVDTHLSALDPDTIRSLNLPPVHANIYLMFETYKDRQDYLKAVMDIISDKTSRLITDSGAMKIESMLGS